MKNENKKQKKTRKPFKFFVYDFVKITGALPVIIWFRIKKVYESKDAKKKIKGAAIICANHLGFTDPIILSIVTWYRRMHFVATDNLFDTKLKAWFFKHILCIPIDKKNVGVNSFKDIISALKDKRAVAVFPEGHINHSEKDFDFFKSGMVLMAMQGKAPIIPMVIINREKWWQRQRVIIGTPIKLPEDRMNLDQINEFSALIRKKEESMLEKYNKWRNEK